MMMVELNSVPVESLPVGDFAAHLRLAEGFEALPGQMKLLEGCLTAAIAALEARLGKYFLNRQFIVRTQKWTASDRLQFPAAPVTEVEGVKLVHSGADEVILDPNTYALQQDAHRPELVSRVGALPALSVNSSAEITVRAGFATEWANVPAALRQAVLMLAEDFFDRDSTVGSNNTLPCSVCLLVEPFRDIRLRGRPGC